MFLRFRRSTATRLDSIAIYTLHTQPPSHRRVLAPPFRLRRSFILLCCVMSSALFASSPPPLPPFGGSATQTTSSYYTSPHYQHPTQTNSTPASSATTMTTIGSYVAPSIPSIHQPAHLRSTPSIYQPSNTTNVASATPPMAVPTPTYYNHTVHHQHHHHTLSITSYSAPPQSMINANGFIQSPPTHHHLPHHHPQQHPATQQHFHMSPPSIMSSSPPLSGSPQPYHLGSSHPHPHTRPHPHAHMHTMSQPHPHMQQIHGFALPPPTHVSPPPTMHHPYMSQPAYSHSHPHHPVTSSATPPLSSPNSSPAAVAISSTSSASTSSQSSNKALVPPTTTTTTTTVSSVPKSMPQQQTLATIFSDLDSRFLVNLPDEELASFERIMFQLQQAHWFYLDWYSDKNPSLPRFSYKSFCETYFKHIPTFKAHLSKFEQVYASFNQYLNAVPVCGCVLVNPAMTDVVMVRSCVINVWGFPRGKLDANEDEVTCAIREVEEEVGFDCRAWFKGYELVPQQQQQSQQGSLTRQVSSESTSSISSQHPSYIEVQSSSKVIRLYILQNVPMNTVFKTKTRHEIAEIAWIPISSLNKTAGMNFSNVTHLVAGKIKTFIKKLKAGEITGYGHYEEGRKHQQQPSYEPSSGKKGKQSNAHNNAASQSAAHNSAEPKSARKGKNSNAGGGSDGKTPSSDRSQSRRSSDKSGLSGGKSLRFDSDTFPASPTNSNGWSAEQMFAANEKLGVVTTVQEEKIQIPAHLEAHLDAVLGRKPQQQQKDNTNANKSGKKGKNNNSKSSQSSTSISSPPMNSSSKSSSTSAQDLDFSHNPYKTIENLTLHQLPNTVISSSNTNNNAAGVNGSGKKPPSEPGVANVLTDLLPSGGKGKKPRNNKKKDSTASPATATPIPQFRIQKRPSSSSSLSAHSNGDSLPISSSAPPAPSFVPTTTADRANNFQFDMASIMESLDK